jgi:hypothetical protein
VTVPGFPRKRGIAVIRKRKATCIVALAFLSCLILGAGNQMGKVHQLIVPDYSAAPEDQAEEMTNELLAAVGGAAGDLIAQLTSHAGLSNRAKVLIIYSLGELRVLRATWVLIENIDLVAESMDPKKRIARWDRYPAREALVKIGPYASRGIILTVGSHKFDKTKVNGYAAVLSEIHTPKYALMKLRDRVEQTEDEAARKQYEMVIARVELAAARQK